MEDLFEGIEGIYFLSGIYLKKNRNKKLKSKRLKKKGVQDWKTFLREMGVWSSPIAKISQEKEITYDLSFSWVKKEYSTSYEKISNDAESEDIKKLLEYCSRLSYESSKKRMIMLWEALQKNWKIYKDKYCNAKYSWFYRWPQTKPLNDSSFLQLLKKSDWIPASDGKFHKPSDLLLGTERNKLLAGDQRAYFELRGDESFLKDLGIRLEPSIYEVINHLNEYRKENDKFNEGDIKKTTEKMEAIYLFFKEKIEETVNDKEKVIGKLSEIFAQKELIFIPSTERQWWSPRKVFWMDFSDKFEDFRGFVQTGQQSAYIDEIKEFFLQIGVKMKPELSDCIDTIEEIKMADFDNKEVMNNILKQIYIYMNELMRAELNEGIANKEIFMTEKHEFKTPYKIYFCSDEELKNAFRAEIDFMIEIAEYKIKHILNKCCIKKFEDCIKIEKEIANEVEIEGGQVKDIISKLLYCAIYLEKRYPEILKEINIDQISKRINELQIKEAKKINVKYIYPLIDGQNEIIKETDKYCFYDKESGIIYKSTKIEIPSIEFVKEISKIFSGAEKEVFTFIDSMFSAKSEEDLEQKLSYFGIKIGDKPTEQLKKERGKKLMRHEKEETIKIGVPLKDIKSEEEVGGETPKILEEEKIESDLINPEDYEFYEKIILEHAENHDKSEVNLKRINVKLKSGIEVVENIPKSEKKIHLRTDAQSIALELVMKYEKFLGRRPEDRHIQLRIGYDIYSKDDSGNERYIEVKHFRGAPGTWDLTSYEWEKAKQEKDKYFVYVVSGLRKGEEPSIQIIQNPANILSPDPPLKKIFSNWKSALGEEIKLKPINQKEETIQ